LRTIDGFDGPTSFFKDQPAGGKVPDFWRSLESYYGHTARYGTDGIARRAKNPGFKSDRYIVMPVGAGAAGEERIWLSGNWTLGRNLFPIQEGARSLLGSKQLIQDREVNYTN
jgi:hypothetical protein